jgi:hypothetical protein
MSHHRRRPALEVFEEDPPAALAPARAQAFAWQVGEQLQRGGGQRAPYDGQRRASPVVPQVERGGRQVKVRVRRGVPPVGRSWQTVQTVRAQRTTQT